MRVEKSVNSELSVEVLISYQGIILSTAKKYLGKQYACWAQDVTQDVLLKAWKNGDKFNPSKGAIVNWLYTMTKNTCLDLKVKKINNAELLINEEYFIDSSESDASLRFSSMKDAIKLALKELSYRDRTILIMRFYFKCSGKEIAQFLEIPEKNMASFMKRAKERLRDLLDYAHAA